MSEQASVSSNPFMLLLNPEVVIATMEKSERLAALNRHTCRPLDRITPNNPSGAVTPEADDGHEEAAMSESSTESMTASD